MATTTKETFFRCKDYQEVQKQTSGYENNNLIEKLVENNKNNPPWKEKSSSFYVTHRQLELCTALMYVICKNKYTDIKISDVGGGVMDICFLLLRKTFLTLIWIGRFSRVIK
jgi:hypothetical protein